MSHRGSQWTKDDWAGECQHANSTLIAEVNTCLRATLWVNKECTTTLASRRTPQHWSPISATPTHRTFPLSGLSKLSERQNKPSLVPNKESFHGSSKVCS